MKSKINNILVFILAFTILFSCFPIQTLAAPTYKLADKFEFKNTDGTITETNQFPAIELTLLDFDGNVLDKTYTNSDGSFEFEFSTYNDIVIYGISGDQPYRIIYGEEDAGIPDDERPGYYYVAVDYDGNNNGDFGFNKSPEPVYVETLYGGATLTKTRTGNNSVLVQNAEYELYYLGTTQFPTTQKLVATKKTNVNGFIDFGTLMCGNYRIVEKTSPSEYFLNTTSNTITVSEGKVTRFTTSDEARCSVTLYKRDASNNQLLSGVGFDLYTKSGTKMGSYTTMNGKITVSDLHYGDYYFIETKARDGYELDTTKYSFTLSGNSISYETTALNKPYPTVTIKKVDADTSAPLSGARFEIYPKGSDTAIYSSLAGDTFSVKLAPGEYVLKEITPPNGYKKMADLNFVVESQTDKTITVENERYKTDLTISKVDKDTGNAISGVSFELIGPVSYRWTTNGSPYVAKNLTAGVYTLVETNPADGYVTIKDYNITASNDCSTITATQDGSQVDIANKTLVVENTKNNLTIKKRDGITDGKIIGAEFVLYAYENGSWTEYKRFTTSQTDYKLTGIPAGNYMLVETKILPNYKMGDFNDDTSSLNPKKSSVYDNGVEFTISNTVKDNTLTVYNEPDRQSITINKTAKQISGTTNNTNIFNLIETWFNLSNEKPLANVEFTLKADMDIYDPSGNGTILYKKGDIVATATTGNDGVVVFDNLPNGSYVVTETKTPSGYVIDPNKKNTPVVINNNDVTLNISNANETITINITKTDATNGNPLANAVFGIYTETDNFFTTKNTLIGTVTTDENGLAVYNGCVPKGKYFVKEISAPEGYVLCEDKKYVDFSAATGKVTNTYDLAFQNDPLTLSIKKVDGTDGSFVVGAKLQLVNEQGVVYDEWITTANSYDISAIPVGNYTLKEISTPIGYETSKDVTFTVSTTSTGSVVMTDERTTGSLTIKKVSTDGDPVSGVVFNIKDGNTVIATGTTNGQGEVKFNKLPVGIYNNGQLTGSKAYSIEEVATPDGYILKTNIDDVVFDIRPTSNNSNKDLEIVIENDYTKLEISKIDILTKQKIDGAVLAIYNIADINADGSVKNGATPYDTWTSSKTETHKINKIPLGTYVLVEVSTPEGYVKAENVEFSITDGGLQFIEMEDDFIKVEFLKKEKGTGNPIVGATLAIYHASALDNNGKIKDGSIKLDEWVTNANANHKIDRFPAGDYVLVELSAPDGYVIADPVEFTVTSTSKIQYVEMIDDYTTIQISKTEPDVKTFVAGASLVLYKAEDVNADGTIKDGAVPYDSWVSQNEAHIITKIPVGQYVLVETNAPDGYTIADNITIDVKATSELQYFAMINDYTKVRIDKLEEGSNKDLLGDAHLVIYKAEDVNADGTIKDGAVHIDKWVSSNENGYTINKLPVGNYILKEVIAPDGYILSADVPFTVTASSELQIVEIVNEYTKISIEKLDLLSNEPLVGAVLALYKSEDINADGTIKDGANFIDKWTTDGTRHDIYRLPVGNYVLVEISAPEGYVKAENLDVKVEATSHTQIITLTNDYTKLHVYKYETGTRMPVLDATLGIFRAEDVNPNGTVKTGATPVEQWKTERMGHTIKKLPSGDYVLIELETPAGYVTADPIEFTVEPHTSNQAVVMEDDVITVEFYKTDIETNEYLSDAHFSLYKAEDVNADGTVKAGATPVETWVSGEEGGYGIVKMPAGDYILIEDEAPTGYVRTPLTHITVKETAEVQKFTIANDFTKLSVKKVDKSTNETLAGAEFAIYKAEDVNADGTIKTGANAVKSWTSTTDAYTTNRMPIGDYVLVELKAPTGYVKSGITPFSITESSNTLELVIKNDYTKVSISKVDISTNEHLDGATLALYKASDIDDNGNIKENAVAVDEWITDGKSHLIEQLAVGNYVLVEISSPDGYIKAENMDITVLETAETQSFVMKDDYTKVVINKLDIETKEHLEGAHLQLIDIRGNIVAEWDTTNEGYVINRLPVGTYLIKETSSPSGYLISETITINVKETTEVQTFDVLDDFTKVEITKNDLETGEILAGATLQLYDADGNLIDEWVSTTEAHRFDRLPTGTYKLVEIAPPAGYLLNTVPVEIVVTDTSEVQKFVINDELDDYDVTISKVDATTKNELPGATLVLYDANGNVIEQWVSSSTPHIIKGLLPGTYTLTEITAPHGYFKAESITFELLPDGKTVDTTIVMENDYTKVAIYKYVKDTENFVTGAKLHIEDMDGNIIVEQWISGNEPHMIYGLPAGKYVLVEDEAPAGYKKADNIIFEVSETGETLKVVMEDEYISERPDGPDTNDYSDIVFFIMLATVSSLAAVYYIQKKRKLKNK